MTRQFTRRQAAAALVATAALSAQVPNAPLPQNAEEELQAARNVLRQNREQIDKFPLHMTTEPAAHFKA
jgi:hypothetical protein